MHSVIFVLFDFEKTPKTPKTLFDRIETKEEEANTTIGIEKHFGREKDTCEFYVYILHVGIKRCFVNFVFFFTFPKGKSKSGIQKTYNNYA